MINIFKTQNGMTIVGQGGKIILFTLPSLLAAIWVHAYLPRIAALPENIRFIQPLGYVLLIPGLFLWASAVIQLLSGFAKGQLITTGAYGVVRNPIYSSATFFLFPAAALLTLTWVYLVPSVFIFAGVMIFIRAEEQQLTQAFGNAYRDYLARVDRLVPFKALIQRHPALTYFVVTFAISWGGLTVLIGGPAGISADRIDVPFIDGYLITAAGPSLASILLTGLLYGGTGFRELLSRFLKWRVGAGWYAVALLAAPISLSATLFVLSQTSPVFVPGILASGDSASSLVFGFSASQKAPFLLFVLALGLFNGFVEELGWTGFAMPRLTRYGIVTTGLVVGFLWGGWHLLSNYLGSAEGAGGVDLFIYMAVLLFSFLPPFRVLMVWVYHRTRSLLVGMLMHASLNIFWLISMPLALTGAQRVTWYLAWAAVLWIFVGIMQAARMYTRATESRPNAALPAR